MHFWFSIVCRGWVAAGGAVLLGLVAVVPTAQGQELDCTVSINYSQITGSEYAFLDELERRLDEYVNERRWTDDRYQPQERIDCSMQIIIQEAVSLTEFQARLVVAARRPIYETAQSTPILRVNDADWRFEYSRGQPLVFDLESYGAITSVIDFYVHIILGYDYDTFSELGGTPYFDRARRIADRAQSTGAPGWSLLGSEQSRAALISELVDPRYRPLRTASYTYHLNGLDRFVNDPEAARQEVLDALEALQTLSEQVNRSYTLSLFFAAKYQELAALFMDGSTQSRAYDLLTRLDPSHSSEYNQIVN